MSVGSFNDFKWEVWKNLMVQFWSMFKLENFGLNAQSENQILKGHIPCNLQKSIILRQFVAVHIFFGFHEIFFYFNDMVFKRWKCEITLGF